MDSCAAPTTSAGDGGRRRRTDLVVVGLDASRSSRNAAEWAAVEAIRRNAVLRLMHACPPPEARAAGPRSSDVGAALMHLRGQTLLNEVAAQLQRAHPVLNISTHLDRNDPVQALRRESENAQLTVMGSWAADRAPGLPLGSVAYAIASVNTAPVAVIHPHHHPNAQGSVLIAVDGSATGDGALEFAFAEAQLRGTDLIAVHVWHDVAIEGTFPYQVVTDTVPVAIEEQRIQLADRLAPWRDRCPQVHVQCAVVFGSPAATLLDFANRAQLVVVGRHGAGGHSGLLLGATSQALVNQSSCPVVVVGGGIAD